MARPTHAAKTLIKEVSKHYPDAQFEHHDPDGLNVFRRLTIEGLDERGVQALQAVAVDSRITIADTHVQDGTAQAGIEFVSSIAADNRKHFHFEGALAILDPDNVVKGEGQETTGLPPEYEKWLRTLKVGELRERYREVIEGADDMKKADLLEVAIAFDVDLMQSTGYEPVVPE